MSRPGPRPSIVERSLTLSHTLESSSQLLAAFGSRSSWLGGAAESDSRLTFSPPLPSFLALSLAR